jgi:aminocarboxymuconate-semialdehyde decarboxylase
VNNRVAQSLHPHPARFVGLGMVPLRSPKLAVAELERLVRNATICGC